MTFRQTAEPRREPKINQIKMKETILHYPVKYHGHGSQKRRAVLSWLYQLPGEGGQHPLRIPPSWLQSDLSGSSFCSQEVAFTAESTETRVTPKAASFRKRSPTELDGTLLQGYLRSQQTIQHLSGARRITKALKFKYDYGW